jgi:hypothetical protein
VESDEHWLPVQSRGVGYGFTSPRVTSSSHRYFESSFDEVLPQLDPSLLMYADTIKLASTSTPAKCVALLRELKKIYGTTISSVLLQAVDVLYQKIGSESRLLSPSDLLIDMRCFPSLGLEGFGWGIPANLALRRLRWDPQVAEIQMLDDILAKKKIVNLCHQRDSASLTNSRNLTTPRSLLS